MARLPPPVRAFLIGFFIPVVAHFFGRNMPWWPDTVSLAVAFGIVGALVVSKARADGDMNRRLWNTFQAIRRHFSH